MTTETNWLPCVDFADADACHTEVVNILCEWKRWGIAQTPDAPAEDLELRAELEAARDFYWEEVNRLFHIL